MLGEEDKDRPSGANRKTYLRSVSWTDRSPTKSKSQSNYKSRGCLLPLQPLAISRPCVEEWPKPGSDDLGVWPTNPPTPGVRLAPVTIAGHPDSEKTPREFEFKKDKLAFFNKECSRILDHIYLGSDAVAKNREILRQNGISHVLNCVGFVCPAYFKNDLVYKTLWLRDSPTEDITSILYDVFDYFEDVREQGGRVLVHCCQGVSRSNSLVIAYLMWKEGQSFEDAFQHVKAARGVTNPNMGFACQLLQCQKRVHAVPASPNSVLRMYRMAPHSPYDPLHLVPKMISKPGEDGLDSRGAFIVHVPSSIYIWTGKSCIPTMLDNAREAAFQVVRYERARGPVVTIKEGEEPPEFWIALQCEQLSGDVCGKVVTSGEEKLSARNEKAVVAIYPGAGKRKVDDYDLDFEIFHKALAGGVVPPFSLSELGSETCLPTRENGWGRLRRKFVSGIMKEFIISSKFSCDVSQSSHEPDTCKEVEFPVSPSDPSLPSSPQCDSPNSFSSYATSSPNWIKGTCDEVEHSIPTPDPLLSPTHRCGSADSFSCFLVSKPKFRTTSPSLSPSTSSLSPSTSDYSSSFTFSPSSSHLSDLSYLSTRPSPSRLESTDPYPGNDASMTESSCLLYKGTSPPLDQEAFSADHALRVANTCSPCIGTFPSIAERRGSSPPARMMLPSVDDASQGPANLVRSWSFSLPGSEDDMIRDVDCNQFERDGYCEMSREEPMLDINIFNAGNGFQCDSWRR